MLARIAALTSAKPGASRVGADQVARRGGGHPLGVRDEHRHRGAPQRRHARDRPGERRRQPRGGARRGAPRRQRLRPQPGRRRSPTTLRARPASASSSATQPPSELPATSKSSIPLGGQPGRDRLREPRRRRLRALAAAASRRSPAGRRRSPRARPRAAPSPAPTRCGRRRAGAGAPAAARSRCGRGELGASAVRHAPEPSRPADRRRRRRLLGFAATLRSGSRAGDAGRQCGLANSACASPIRCSAKPASQ